MDNFLDYIKKSSEEGLVVCPVGVGSAFAKLNHNSSFIIAKDGKTLLFDLGANVPLALNQLGMKVTDFDAYYISHAHADHIGGVEELLFMSRYVTKTKPKMIMNSECYTDYWVYTLKGGIAHSESPSLKFHDVANISFTKVSMKNPLGIKRSIDRINILGFSLEFFQTCHVPAGKSDMFYDYIMFSSGICVDNRLFISGDTQFDSELINHYKDCELLFHDCQLFDVPEENSVHASYNQLKELPEELRSKMLLYHYGDTFADFEPIRDGFKGFAKPGLVYHL